MIRPLAILGVGHVSMPELALGAALKLDLDLLERTLRRGLSDTTRLFMHTAKIALSEAAVAPERVHVIFASAFGEIATAEALLLEAHDQNGSSPARFRNSVHNTTTGLFSISTKNVLPSTAIAAGWSTVAMALCEASAQLACDAERVLLVFAEERVPLAISADYPHHALGAAFVLGRAGESPARAIIANMRPAPAALLLESVIDERSHPLAPALELARAVERAEVRTLIVGEGPPPLCIDLEPEVAA